MSWIDSVANAFVGVVVSKVFSKNKAGNDDNYSTGPISNNGSSSYGYNYGPHKTQPQGYNHSSQNTQDYNFGSHHYPPSPYPSNNYYNCSPHNTLPPNSYYPPSPYPTNNYNYSQSHNYYYPPSPNPSSSSQTRAKYSPNRHIYSHTIDEEHNEPSRGFFGRKKKKRGYEEKGRATRGYGDSAAEEREYHRSYGFDFSPSHSHWPHSQTDITRY